MSKPEDRLAELGLKLPVPAVPLAAYIPVARTGNLLFVSGQLSADGNGIITGISGQDIDLESARLAARQSALGVLAQIVHSAKVPLENIEQVIKLSIFVAATPQYSEHHLVANGASQLISDVLGDRGKHARAAFGVASLPMGAAVEVEAIVEITK